MVELFNEKTVKAFTARIYTRIHSFKQEPKKVLREETKLLNKEFMDQTPPFNSNGEGTSKQAEAQGKARIRKDIIKCITPASTVFHDTGTASKQMDRLLKRKNYQALNAALKNMKKLSKWDAVRFNPEWHTAARNRYSRFRNLKCQKKMTMDERKLESYIRKKEKRAGWLKSGPGYVVKSLGGKVPAWVSRHFNSTSGEFVDDTAAQIPKISLGFVAIIKHRAKMNYGLMKRERQMGRRIDHWFKHEVKKLAR